MGLFGKSFEEKVTDAIETIKTSNYQVNNLEAEIEDKVVTLKGTVPDMENLKNIVTEFNNLVETENTINKIKIEKPDTMVSSQEETARIHVVVPGDTLGKIAKNYYGKSSMYMKIFEANKNILDDPNVIQVGQKLIIPK
jgi:nucleoid-associated protein YgaU